MNPISAFLVAFFLIPFVQTFLQLADRLPVWHDRLKIGRIAIFVLCGISFFIDGNDISTPVFFLSELLVATPAFLLKDKDPNARLLLWMIVPVASVLLIDNLFEFWTPKFYIANNNIFEYSKTLALIASTIIGIMAYKQQKTLDKALKEQEVKLQIEEENNRILESKKLDLEYQVRERTAELTKQKEELEQALESLKATQNQLIQSEKLASLGELTAGIAHEIQNPLNFVNNFSELSSELIDELKTERLKGSESRELEDEILGDLLQNLEKINHHGKRASSIVSGMLEHSRASTGIKQLTDINKLADEYLRLSYHGLRAKDKSFNADFKTDFDENLPKTNVVSQDIGRVLLNLVNNAFYAVHNVGRAQNPADIGAYQPTVTISTQKIDNQIIVKVQDNGIGMNEATKAKIFQPFFTTKPTGQGTGLGLSLAYDIVTKGHGGTIEVESVEGQGTTFIVKLPI
jgi:two-component system, NtrC family, sensor kinase